MTMILFSDYKRMFTNTWFYATNLNARHMIRYDVVTIFNSSCLLKSITIKLCAQFVGLSRNNPHKSIQIIQHDHGYRFNHIGNVYVYFLKTNMIAYIHCAFESGGLGVVDLTGLQNDPLFVSSMITTSVKGLFTMTQTNET